MSDYRWWLSLPPCPQCGRSHVLIDCSERLAREAGASASTEVPAP